jgi:AcrR family transcriptional regulator
LFAPGILRYVALHSPWSTKELRVSQAAQTIDRRRKDTGRRILEAAEQLFSQHGYDGVSIRDITSLANVRLALSTYHFGTKENLLERVLERRAEVLNQERQAALSAALTNSAPTVADVLSAFVEPYLRHACGGEPGWRNYCRLIAVLSPSGRWPDLLGRLFDDTAQQFINALMVVQPSVDRVRATRCFLFCVGTMLASFAGTVRLDRLTHSTAMATDLETTYAYLIPFLVGGVTAIAQLPAEKKRGRATRSK